MEHQQCKAAEEYKRKFWRQVITYFTDYMQAAFNAICGLMMNSEQNVPRFTSCGVPNLLLSNDVEHKSATQQKFNSNNSAWFIIKNELNISPNHGYKFFFDWRRIT